MNWTTRNGIKIDISDMGTSHIKNCIALLERAYDRGQQFGCIDGPDNMDMYYDVEPYDEPIEKVFPKIKALKSELKRRSNT